MKFLLYGANGHTAAFAIEYAKEQGINLILAGRSQESIKPLAEKNGFDYRIFDLESNDDICKNCLLYTSPSPRDRQKSRMPSSA